MSDGSNETMSDGTNDVGSLVDLVRQRLRKLNDVVIELCDVAKDNDEKLKAFEGSDALSTVESLQQEVNARRTKLGGICDAMSAQEKLQKEFDEEIDFKTNQKNVLSGEIDENVEKLKGLQDQFERLNGDLASGKKVIRQMKGEIESEKKNLPEGNVLIALDDLYEQNNRLRQQFNKDIEDTRNELTALLNSNIENEIADAHACLLDLQVAAKSMSKKQGRRCALKELMYKVNHVTEEDLEELLKFVMSQDISDCILSKRKPLECKEDLIAVGLDIPMIGQWVLDVVAPDMTPTA